MDDPATEDPWAEYAAGWDDDEAARAYASAAFESLIVALAAHDVDLQGLTVCDFGCGTGLLTERLAATARSVDAVDTSPAMLARLAAKVDRGAMVNVHPSSALPTSTESHDLVVCSSVLGFVDDHPGTVRSLARLLRPSGLLMQWDWEADPTDDDPHGLTRAEIREALTDAGLTAVEVDVAFEVSVEGETMRPLMGIGRRP